MSKTIDINELVKRLRDGCVCSSEFGKCTRCYAADALEAMAGEVERLKGVLEEGVRMAAAMNMTAGWVDSAKQILGGRP